MAGKDKLEFDVLANDKASKVFDKVARAGKDVGAAVDKGADKGKASLKKLSEGAKDAGDSLGKLGDKGKEGLGKLTEGLKAGPLAMVGLGAGLGAMLMEGFGQAMENQDANHLLTAQLGASDDEMAKLGKISGDLYKNAFGESVAEVDDVMKTVFQSGLASVKDGEDAIKGVTTQVMNYAKISGEEALPITRAISQMLKTGLAKNATEAFDLLTRGTQKGIDKSEDMLDTVNEYGTQFRKLGLEGPQAFGLLSQAIQAGARDADTAADALKEFSIRAVDGSATTTDGFKSIGLSAKSMSADIAAGGPKASAALGLTLDKLRAIKDPAERSRIAVELFGTKAEDLGDALYAMNLGTAATEFGEVAGAAERAGDVINDTASNKLATVGRTIKSSITDAIGKYALPKLEEFADWFNGPGKMAMVGWALQGGQAILGFADKTLGALNSMLGGMASYGRVALTVAAASVAAFSPSLAANMLQQAGAIGGWAKEAQTGIAGARGELKGWSDTLAKADTKVKLEANIEDLDQKIAKAQAELRDPGLTKTRKAELTASIAQLTKQKDAAIRKLNDPGLIKARVATLTATKATLDSKIATAKKQLADPKLSATKTASLKAYIGQLLRAKAEAQASINSLTGKTVNVTLNTYKNMIETTIKGGELIRRAGGGKVTKGQSYIVGEKRAELFTPDENGTILPEVPGKGGGYGGGGPGLAAYGGVATLSFDDSETSRFIVQMLRKGLNNGGTQGNVQILIAGRPA